MSYPDTHPRSAVFREKAARRNQLAGLHRRRITLSAKEQAELRELDIWIAVALDQFDVGPVNPTPAPGDNPGG